MRKVHKSVTVFRHSFLAGSMMDELKEEVEEVNGTMSSYTQFNEKGHIIREISYSSDEKPEQMTTYKYNDADQLMEEILFDEENEIAERKTYEYDDKGRMLKKLIHYADDTFDTMHYEYNENGLIMNKHIVDADGIEENKHVYEYEKGNLIRSAEYDNEGTLLSEEAWKYDEKGNEIEMTKWDKADDRLISTLVDYFENGDRQKVRVYNHEEELVEKILYEENEEGTLLRIIEEDPYNLNTTEFIYDERKNLIEQIELNREGEVNSRVTREYNEDNEMVETVIFIDRHGAGVNQHYKMKYVFE
jgi:hypothetical protein